MNLAPRTTCASRGVHSCRNSILQSLPMWLAALLCVLSLAACSPIFRNHGYVPDEGDLEQIEVGKDTRESVAEKIGRPSAAGLLNDVGWYYVQSRWKHSGGRAPEEVERQVVAVTFSEAGTVSNVERFGLEQGRVVALSRRVTDSNIKGVGFLRQLFGNIGNLRAENLGL
jgi:outer membrane protein assembly factor BamE (lipoprotein component of BamABCDE complex)